MNVPNTPPRRCGTCRWFHKHRDGGYCAWTPDGPTPLWFDNHTEDTRANYGTHCPAWTPKEKTHD